MYFPLNSLEGTNGLLSLTQLQSSLNPSRAVSLAVPSLIAVSQLSRSIREFWSIGLCLCSCSRPVWFCFFYTQEPYLEEAHLDVVNGSIKSYPSNGINFASAGSGVFPQIFPQIQDSRCGVLILC
ncbi:hypothetical protein I3843_08G011600 [Carya illinoinensis]|nr:hypothetical protein I3843_08G011600 [Carya illinoinensis]